MGSVSSLMVQGLVLNAVVDPLQQIPLLKRKDLQEQTHVSCCCLFDAVFF